LPECDDPNEAQRLMNDAHERRIRNEQRFLHVAREHHQEMKFGAQSWHYNKIDDLLLSDLSEVSTRRK
jgi:hypothetical protein